VTQYTVDDVIAIAKTQRIIIWLVIASLLEFVLPIVFIILLLFKIIYVYCFIDELKLKDSWLWLVFLVVPLINIIMLLMLNSKATAAIKSKGVKVGIMGANKAQLAKLAATI